jgi:hypothetical protein
MSNVKCKIYEFNCNIYPRRIWICFYPDREALDEMFGKGVACEMDDDMDACVQNIIRHSDNKWGELIRFKSKNVPSGHIAHEAAHAAMDILAQLDVDFDGYHQEALAYMIGWITNCIHSCLKGKPLEDVKIFEYPVVK